MNKKRNTAVEIYRVLLMLGIVTLHEFSYVGLGHHWVVRLLTTCVVGFVFISGYYGVRLSLGRFSRLYGVALFCAAWFGVSAQVAGGGVCSFIEHLRVWWFVNAYIMLMLFSPLINHALKTCESRRVLLQITLPILFLIFGWSFLSVAPVVKDVIPADRSFGTHNGLTLVGIYLAARLYRILEIESKFSRRCLLIAWMVSGAFCACNLGKYNSPFALVFAASSFTIFRQLGESNGYKHVKGLGTICAFLGPSMLSVYLLHVGGIVPFVGIGAIRTNAFFDRLCGYGFGTYSALGLLIAIVFAACVGIDLLRRMAVGSAGKIFSRVEL